MIVNLFLVFIAINLVLGGVSNVAGLEGVFGNNGCYYDSSAAPALDPATAIDPATSLTDTVDDLESPSNTSNTGVGDGTTLDNFANPLEQGYKQLETFVHLLTGGYITDVIGSVSLMCEITCDVALNAQGNCEGDFVYTPVTNPVWDQFVLGFHVIIGFGLVLTISSIFLGNKGLNRLFG